MDFLSINDVAERTELPKPTIYRMFHELSDIIPHRRVGRKILFPKEAMAKITEIRKLTADEGFTYRMVRETMGSSDNSEEVELKPEPDNRDLPQVTPDLSRTLSRSITASFDGLREDLRLLTAQIDRQNDLLSRFIAHDQSYEDLPPSVVNNKTAASSAEEHTEREAQAGERLNLREERVAEVGKTRVFRLKWSNFWAGKGWKA